MLWRLLSFLACQLLGALVARYFASFGGSITSELEAALLGTVLGGLGWLLLDMSRGLRLLRWLRAGDVSEPMAYAGWWREVSDRMRRLILAREQMTRDSERRLQDFLAALQASPNGVVLLDAQGKIEWFNQTAAAHFGLDANRDLLQYVGNMVRDPGFASYFASRDYQNELAMPARQSTHARPVKLAVRLHPYGVGRLLLLSRDVTAVEQAEAMRRDFVANVSHEIRTPLTVLAGFVETLQALPLTESEREHYLSLMAQQAQRMQTLVNDLLTLSRLEGSPPPGTSDWVSLPLLLRQTEQEGRALSAALNRTAESGHRFVIECSAAVEIAGVTNEVLSAMANLVSNAVRYTPQGGEVRMRARCLPDGRAEFSVQDSGLGIAPEHIPRLTERFYRVDRGRSRDSGGTGLGLAIVKHVVQRHGAELRIDSTMGKGSVFTIIFAASRVRPAELVGVPAPQDAPATRRW